MQLEPCLFAGVNLPFNHAKDTQIQEEQQIRPPPPPPHRLIIKTYLAEMIDYCIIWRGSAFNSNALDLHPRPSTSSSSSSLHCSELIHARFIIIIIITVVFVDLRSSSSSRPETVRSILAAAMRCWLTADQPAIAMQVGMFPFFYICGTLSGIFFFIVLVFKCLT